MPPHTSNASAMVPSAAGFLPLESPPSCPSPNPPLAQSSASQSRCFLPTASGHAPPKPPPIPASAQSLFALCRPSAARLAELVLVIDSFTTGLCFGRDEPAQ